MREDSLSLSLLASCFIHGAVIILASIILKHTVNLRGQDFLPIGLVDMPRQEQSKPIEKVEAPPEIKKPPPPPKVEKAKELKPLAKNEIIQPKLTPPPAAFLKRSWSSPSKQNRRKAPNLSPLLHWLPRAGPKAGAVKLALVIFLPKGTQRLCRDQGQSVRAAAPLTLV